MSIRKSLVLTILVFFSSILFAKELTMKGYTRKPSSQELVIKGYVQRFIESENSFNILISQHSAFYIFPKGSNAVEVKEFLQKSQTDKLKYSWIVDPFDRSIYEIKNF